MAGPDDLVADAPPDLDDTPDVASRPVADAAPDLDASPDDGDELDQAIDTAMDAADADNEPAGASKDQKTGRFVSSKPSTGSNGDAGGEQTESRPERFASWPNEHRAAYEKLAPEARGVVDAHERLVIEGVKQQVLPALQEAEPFMQVLTEPGIAGYLQRVSAESGAAPGEIVRSVLGFERTLRYGSMSQKVALIQKMVRDYGIVGGNEQAVDTMGEQPEVSPRVQAALHDMQRQLEDRDWQIRQLAERQMGSVQQQLTSEVQTFATAADAQGNPKYPLYEAVRGTMADLIEGGRAQSMAQAYQIAVKPLEDEVARRTQSTSAAQRARAQKAVERAERTRPIRGSMGPLTQKDMSLDDIISAGIDAAA